MATDQPENRNFLSPTGFKFSLKRTPKVSFFCNSANIPELTLGIAVQPTYLKDIELPGDKLIFGDLTLRFLVDEDLKNYLEIQNWMRGIGYPESLEEIYTFQKTGNINPKLESQKQLGLFSDGTLQVLTNSSLPNFQVAFKDLFPYSLGTLSFDATAMDVQYFTADVSFKYTIYNIVDLGGNLLWV